MGLCRIADRLIVRFGSEVSYPLNDSTKKRMQEANAVNRSTTEIVLSYGPPKGQSISRRVETATSGLLPAPPLKRAAICLPAWVDLI
ncbi:hypothetical protein KIN20_035248 [Parelaphostrongylus tenuis]|uniref:Uncharacterized protein n=1 Tax=Parelaphostrongylus tenuis TaxID=148309 RepID=A0AAD5WKA3_PARTN|nr:hypothetical protein KIN20_035248 [Parelaphostrongylus tenuis]